ncbi:MAG: OB-fold nucleic acid binding domain-containing protein, partial [Nitrososphaerota archaeon]
MKRTHYMRDLAPGEATISGWVSVVRDLGNVKFVVLRDFTGTVQVTLKKGVVSDQLLEAAGKLNPEDVVTVHGNVVSRGNAPRGLELIPSKLEVISRSE